MKNAKCALPCNDEQGPATIFFSVILRGSFHRHWEHRMAWLGFGCYWSCELLAKGWQWVWKKAFFLCLCLKYATVICYEHADAHFLCPCCDCVCMEKRSRFLLFFTVIHVCWTRERERESLHWRNGERTYLTCGKGEAFSEYFWTMHNFVPQRRNGSAFDTKLVKNIYI